MKGKGCFTAAETDAIRELLKQLRRSDRPTQKRLRHTLRKRYCFWISDFDKSYKGFGVADFNALVACGKITIGNCGASETAAPSDLGSNPQPCYEELRARYRPDKVRVLFVGESPPASGEFFYLGNSRLYQAFREAFGSPDDFLAEFQSRGFFLADLVSIPVNKMARGERESARRAHMDSLSSRLREYRPVAVVTVMMELQPYIANSMERANLSVPHYAVPFPRSEHRRRFVKELRKLLRLWPK